MNSQGWDEWNQLGGPKYPHEKVIQFCFRNYKSHERAGVKALDLGCGSGVHSVFLASEGFVVTAVDSSEVGVLNTKRKLAELSLHGDLYVQELDRLDLPEDFFHLVVCVSVLDSAGPEAAQAGVKRVSSLLAAGGRGIFMFASDRDFRVLGENSFGIHGFSRAEVEKLFAHPFSTVWIDRCITTYDGERIEQNDWLVTVLK